jgi:nitrogen fixation protein NifU and related proteins
MSQTLYQDRIVALAKAKVGAGTRAAPTAKAMKDNPLCGDRVNIEIRVDDQGRIAELAHKVRGCALCEASASALTARAIGHTATEVAELRREIDSVLNGESAGDGDFAAFAPVAQHRSRRDCVTLPFEALRAALSSVA